MSAIVFKSRYDYQLLCAMTLRRGGGGGGGGDPRLNVIMTLISLEVSPKSKTLISQDRYGIVFMHGQNVMADISAQSQSFHFGFRLCILILGHCLVSQP